MSTNLSKALRDELDLRGMTVTDLVRAAQEGSGGPSERSVWRAVTGETSHPRQDVRQAVERALDWPEGTCQRIIQGQSLDEATAVGGRPALSQRVHLLERQMDVVLARLDIVEGRDRQDPRR